MNTQGQQGEDKNSMAILWIIAGVFFVGAVIWWSFAAELKYFFIKLRMLELTLAYWFFKIFPVTKIYNEVESALMVAKTVTSGTITLNTAEYLSTMVGKIYRWPILVFLMLFVYIIYGHNIKMKYKKHYNMQSLAMQERVEWPQINPILELDLVEEDLDTGPWAMGVTPVMFCKQHKLIEVSVLPAAMEILNKGSKFKAVLDKTKTDQVFIKQLGRMWRGPDKLPIHRRALLAAFVARGMRDTKVVQNFLIQINRSATKDHSEALDFTGADALLQKYYNSKSIQRIVQAHAYEYTVFVELFLFARQDGVFPTSDFLWLKPRDRSFWYVLNSVGRQTLSCESAGVIAHFLAEKSLGRALTVPIVGKATDALQFALDELIYVPSEEEQEELLKIAANKASG